PSSTTSASTTSSSARGTASAPGAASSPRSCWPCCARCTRPTRSTSTGRPRPPRPPPDRSDMSTRMNALWERYGRLSPDEIDADASTAARQCILDWLGCALSGSTEPLAQMLRAEFADEAVLAGNTGPASVIGSAQRVTAKTAALVNGAAGHALDYDDTNLVGGLHATTAVLPAALALAEQTGASGADLLCAYVAGVEVCARLRVVIGDEHYRQGWHITSTLGVFGAVAAAGWLLRLDTEQFGRAVGLAASQVGGVHANFGTMTKPFHAGF